MPELPAVHTVTTRLDAELRGSTVASVRVLRPDIVRHGPRDLGRRLAGRAIDRIDRHGKQIVCRLAPDVELRVHLGMTGNLAVVPRVAALLPHTHVRMTFAGRDDELRFRDPRRFGGLWLVEGGIAGGRFSIPLGPDALAIDLPTFRSVLARPKRIKALLLDQSAIAGLGNIYVDEALHRAGIHPLRIASGLDHRRAERLHGEVRAVLDEAIAAGGSSLRDYRGADGEPGWFQVEHRVYGREGEPCTTCGRPIRRILVATRSTHLCTRCQPAPRPRRARS